MERRILSIMLKSCEGCGRIDFAAFAIYSFWRISRPMSQLCVNVLLFLESHQFFLEP